MRKIIGLLLVCIMLVMSVGCDESSNKHEGEAKTPSGSSIQHGRNYKEVIKDFEDKGFINIKTEAIEDLITGFLTKDGEVEEVSIGGDFNYSPDKWLPIDTEVVIRYHTFPNKDTKNQTESKATTTPESTDDPNIAKSNEEILTVDNCKELAAILSVKDPFDPIIKEFADKYTGRNIEFEGNTANVDNNEEYKTRFNYLIYAGDYSETTAIGPYFQFHDVNYSDLHLTGDNIPNVFGTGLNVHIIATVGTYDETSGFFQLKPVTITMR